MTTLLVSASLHFIFFKYGKTNKTDPHCISSTIFYYASAPIGRMQAMLLSDVHGHCQPSDAGGLAQRVVVYIGEISAWMKANRLQLNLAKTEVLWCASSRRQHLVPTASVRVGDVLVS